MEEYKKYKQISYCLNKLSSSFLLYNANSIQNKVSLKSDCHINRKENEDLLCSIIRHIEFVVTKINKILCWTLKDYTLWHGNGFEIQRTPLI